MTRKVSTPHAPAAIGPYSQAVWAGPLLYVSGQLPIDPATGRVVDDVEKATHQVIDNLEAILKAAGLDLEHVVKAEVFLRDINDFQKMNKAYGERFRSPTPPARQTTEARLAKDVSVEISCVAFKS